MTIPSLLRLAEHEALRDVELTGTVLDIGGDTKSHYQRLMRGAFSLTTMNLDPLSKPDIYHDLETPLPCTNEQFDNAIMINVLEHIFNYKQLLTESMRVIKSGGKLVVVVPFMIPVHPSPLDFHRYTDMTLVKELELVGGTTISVKPLGTGIFSMMYVSLDRLMPHIVRATAFYTVRPIAYCLDWAFTKLSRKLGKKYVPSDYALGYCVVANKK
jgi:SAM-dependent methyltransferase